MKHAFLTYLSRSGSTFLAGLLDSYADINVTLEAGLPDGTKRDLLEIADPGHVWEALDKLYADDKFRAWNIDRPALARRLQSLDYPVRYPALFHAILDECFQHREGRLRIYKCSYYLEYVDHVRTLFPDAKFIFILRDIRAIYHSQKQAVSSRKGAPMATNPFGFAAKYNRAAALLDQYGNRDWFHLVRYEDLLCKTEAEMESLLRFLGVSSRRGERTAQAYYAAIPDGQKLLHANISAAPQAGRAGAWRAGLTRWELHVLQHSARATLKRYGYDIADEDPLSQRDRLICLAHWLGHVSVLARKGAWKFLRGRKASDV